MGDLTIELWAEDQHRNGAQPFNWKFRVDVPGGGLARRELPQMQFEAPDSAYSSPIEIEMSDGAKDWRNSFEDEFFVKLGNGTFGRMRFRVTPAGGHFASITSYLNPTPGSRNLEFDPKKQIKAK